MQKFLLFAAPLCAACLACAAENWAHPDLVERARQGAVGVADVSWWGADAADSHRFVAEALRSAAPTVRLDRAQSVWNVGRTVWLSSDKTLLVPEGVELVAKKGAFHSTGESLVAVKWCTNVVICGGGTLRMQFEDYTNRALYAWSEWRHSVYISSSHNVTVENLKIVDSGGDGVYISESIPGHPSSAITLRNLVCRRGNRQGVSVISVAGLLMENVLMEDTCGTPPMSGIDFEPNDWFNRLDDILLRNCVVRNNRGFGFDFSIYPISEVSITLENCRSEGNAKGTHFPPGHNLSRGMKGQIRIVNTSFNDEVKDDNQFRRSPFESHYSFGAELVGCTRANPTTGAMEPLPADCGWRAAPTLRHQNGQPMQGVRWTPEMLAGATVCDACPGCAVPLSKVGVRGKGIWLLHAAQAGRVAFGVQLQKIGSSKLRPVTFAVATAGGKPLAKLAGPTNFGEKVACAFEAPAAGFYRLTGDAGSHVVYLTDSTDPVAIVSGASGRAPGLDGGDSTAYLRIPAGQGPFALAGCGGGGGEMLRLRLTDPAGHVVWDRDNIASTRFWRSMAPTPGVWKVEALRPSKGCSDDYSIDILGAPIFLFLSSEKTWEAK